MSVFDILFLCLWLYCTYFVPYFWPPLDPRRINRFIFFITNTITNSILFILFICIFIIVCLFAGGKCVHMHIYLFICYRRINIALGSGWVHSFLCCASLCNCSFLSDDSNLWSNDFRGISHLEMCLIWFKI